MKPGSYKLHVCDGKAREGCTDDCPHYQDHYAFNGCNEHQLHCAILDVEVLCVPVAVKEPVGEQERRKFDLLTRVENDFDYKYPSRDDAEQFETLRGMAHDLAKEMIYTMTVGRELSLALTPLEMTVFWVNAGLIRKGEE